VIAPVALTLFVMNRASQNLQTQRIVKVPHVLRDRNTALQPINGFRNPATATAVQQKSTSCKNLGNSNVITQDRIGSISEIASSLPASAPSAHPHGQHPQFESDLPHDFTKNWIRRHRDVHFPPDTPDTMLDQHLEKETSTARHKPQVFSPEVNLIFTEVLPGVSEACVWSYSRRVPTHPALSLVKVHGRTLIPFERTRPYIKIVIYVMDGEIVLKSNQFTAVSQEGNVTLTRKILSTGAVIVIPPNTHYSLENWTEEEVILQKFEYHNC
jgi:hypothetical protein